MYLLKGVEAIAKTLQERVDVSIHYYMRQRCWRKCDNTESWIDSIVSIYVKSRLLRIQQQVKYVSTVWQRYRVFVSVFIHVRRWWCQRMLQADTEEDDVGWGSDKMPESESVSSPRCCRQCRQTASYGGYHETTPPYVLLLSVYISSVSMCDSDFPGLHLLCVSFDVAHCSIHWPIAINVCR